MGFSNSPLVNYTKISPNKNVNRNHKIDTITIHCVVGQCSVETIGNVFAPKSRQASSNYGIGPDGRIGMYVEEKDRSWCSSSASNDHRAVTIEVASDRKEPYAVTAKAYESLINLVVDICKRNGISKLVWSTNKSDRVNKDDKLLQYYDNYGNKKTLYSQNAGIVSDICDRYISLYEDNYYLLADVAIEKYNQIQLNDKGFFYINNITILKTTFL